MIRIRPELHGDAEMVARIVSLAFGRPNEARLIETLRQSPGFIPGLSLVAVANHDAGPDGDGVAPVDLVGHILFSRIHIDPAGAPPDVARIPTLALAPVAVQPDWQHRGVGSRLVREGLSRATALGHAHVIVLGHPGFYPRFGFVPARRHGIAAPFEVPDEAFLALELRPGSLAGCAGTVRYPDLFLDV